MRETESAERGTDVMALEEPGTSTFESVGFSHMDALYTYAQWMIEDPEDSSAVLREAYGEAFRHWHEDLHEEEIRLDLFRSVRNLIVRIREHGNRRRPTLRTAGDTVPAREESSGHADSVREPVISFLESLTRRAVRLMPEEYGSALLLSDVDTLTYQEIGEIMNCSVEEVRRRIHTGQKLLRQQLSKYLDLLSSEPVVRAAALAV